MRIAITGATGLLGRNLLFEILKQNTNNLDNLEVFVFSRPKNEHSSSERIEKIIIDDGLDYINIDKINVKDLLTHIIPISFDLTKDDLSISSDDYDKLNNKPIDLFFHIAAYTDFRDTPSVKSKLHDININGTNRLLNLIRSLSVSEIIYVGSAYSCGNVKGHVNPDYISLNNDFRNPYELSKLVAEVNFREFAKNNNYKMRIFRPIGICGRLIENPIGGICKYDIFYGWAAFFLKHKIKHFKSLDNIYEQPLYMPIRIRINTKSGLNIVPVDYAAKIMYALCKHQDPGQSYHLVNDNDIPHKEYLKLMLDTINIEGYDFIDSIPNNMNSIEILYYNTVGKIFTPYAVSDDVYFNTDNLDSIKRKVGLKCPPMNKDNFTKLMQYAKDNFFGLSESGHKGE